MEGDCLGVNTTVTSKSWCVIVVLALMKFECDILPCRNRVYGKRGALRENSRSEWSWYQLLCPARVFQVQFGKPLFSATSQDAPPRPVRALSERGLSLLFKFFVVHVDIVWRVRFPPREFSILTLCQ